MNYYYPDTNQKVYLYDKVRQSIIACFDNEKDVEDWFARHIYRTPYGFGGLATDLTLDMSPPVPIYKDFGSYEDYDKIETYRKHLILIKNVKQTAEFMYYTVYNYLPFINRLNENIRLNKPLISGFYLAWNDKKRLKKNMNLPEFRKGPVPNMRCYHRIGSASNNHLIVNKSERSALFTDLDDFSYYDKETDSFIEYDVPKIRNGRNRRKALCMPFEEGYSHCYWNERYKNHSSWKNQKKRFQWM